MKWETARRGLTALGVLYAVSLVPATIRPTWTASPFVKSSPTIDITATGPKGALPPHFGAKIKDACRAPWLARPFMGSAKTVTVIVNYNLHPIAAHDYHCALYE